MTDRLKTILSLEVPVIVEIGRHRMSVDDVLALGPGAIVELEKPAEESLDLLVHNKKVGSGHAVKVGENFGIKISDIGSAKERVEAMGG